MTEHETVAAWCVDNEVPEVDLLYALTAVLGARMVTDAYEAFVNNRAPERRSTFHSRTTWWPRMWGEGLLAPGPRFHSSRAPAPAPARLASVHLCA